MLTLGEKLQTYKLKNSASRGNICCGRSRASNVATFGRHKIEGYLKVFEKIDTFIEHGNEIRKFRHWPQIALNFSRLTSKPK